MAFNQKAALPIGLGLRPVVAGLRIEFALELHYPGVVEVCTGIVSIGRTSFSVAQVGRQTLPTTRGSTRLILHNAELVSNNHVIV